MKNADLRKYIDESERTCHDTVAANIRRFDQFKVKFDVKRRNGIGFVFQLNRKRSRWLNANNWKRNKNYSILLITIVKHWLMKLKVN